MRDSPQEESSPEIDTQSYGASPPESTTTMASDTTESAIQQPQPDATTHTSTSGRYPKRNRKPPDRLTY